MENNIKQTKINLKFVSQPQNNIPTPIENIGKGDFITFGEENQYPQELFGMYSDCTILQSCINTLYDYAIGAGFDEKTMEEVVINKKNQTLLDLFQKITIDYAIFGAFAINVLTDKYHKISELYPLDVQNIRLSEDEKDVYYSKKWGKYTKKANKYPIYDKENTAPNSVFYFKNPKSRGKYGLPMYSSALRDIKTQIEISNFHLNSILQNFCPSGIISFCEGVADEETQQRIEDLINQKFSGSDNASRLLLTWSDSPETAPQFQRLSEDGFDMKYNALAETTQNNILASFRVSAQLVGISTQATGFSAIEYSNAFSLWKSLVIKPFQSEIEKAFKKIDYEYQPTMAESFVKFDGENNNSENQNVL